MNESVPPARAFAGTLKAALAAGLVVALVDVEHAVMEATTPVGGFAQVRALQAALGLYAAAALLFAVVEGALIAGLLATVPLDVRGFVKRVREDRAQDRKIAAGILATAIDLALLIPILFFWYYFIAADMAGRRNAALSSGIVTAALVPLLALAWPAIYQVMLRMVVVVPPPRTLVLALALVAVVALGLTGALASVDWRVIDFGPSLSLALFFVLQVVIWRLSRFGARIPARTRRMLWGGLAAIGALCLLVSWLRFGDEPRSLALVNEESMGAKVLLRAARRFADRDGDHFAGRLGGGDCNDRNPKIHPGAEEIRGNGVDEDCDGIDPAKAAPRHVEVTSKKAHEFSFKGNILIIVLDTVRADRLNPQVMPHVSEFAKNAVVFTRAYAQAPNTPRSFPSWLTSRFPSEVKYMRLTHPFSPLEESPLNYTVFQALHAQKYFNIGLFSHFYMAPRIGLRRGFDEWDNEGMLSVSESNPDVSSPRVTAKVTAKLRELGKSKDRFVLWTHLADAHSRYMEHAEFPAKSSGLKGLEERYDGEVSFVDEHVGIILDELEKSGLSKNTAVILFSDHGEAFGEHKFGGERIFFHGQTLYDEMLRVPLAIHVPGIAGRTVETPVMLVDIAPTLLDLVKAPRPENFHGRSLLGAMLGEPLAVEPVFAELLPAADWKHRARVIMIDDLKLYQKLSENAVELYDLKRDPGETLNLAPSDGAKAAQMQQRMAAFEVEEVN